MTSIKVLHSITGLNIGGAEYMLARYLRSLGRVEYASSVLSLMRPGPLAASLKSCGVDLQTLGMAEGRIRLGDFVRLRRALRRASPDLIHGWMYHGNAAASIGAFLAGSAAPVIWSIHHSLGDIRKEKPLTRRLIGLLALLSKSTSAISYCSRVAADDHERIGFDARRRVVIPNGIDCDNFRPSEGAKPELASLLGIPATRAIVGNVARFHPMKDHASLVHALARLLRRGYDVQGLFIGQGHENGAVRQIARDLGIDARISTLGARDDVQDLVPGFDVYAISSKWGEAFPLAVAEAMAAGVPVVATDVGDCRWLLGDTGPILPPGDADALAAGLASLLDLSPDARRDLGINARRRVMENFSIQQYVSRHRTLYEEALDLRHRRTGGAA